MKTEISTKKSNQSKSKHQINVRVFVSVERQKKTVSFFLKRQAAKKNGSCPILCRVTINGVKKAFSTQLDIHPDKWDIDTQRVIPINRNDPDAAINNKLVKIINDLEDHYNNVKRRDGIVSPETLLKSFFGQDEQHKTFLTLFDEHLKEKEELVEKNQLSKCGYNKYVLTRVRVEDFMKKKYNASDMLLTQITKAFPKDFEHYLRVTHNLSTNVLAKDIQFIKKVVTLAFEAGIIPHHPFANHAVKKEKKNRGFLTDDELNRILEKQMPCERLEHIRDIFIFSCFTGLAYIDVKTLKQSDMVLQNGQYWLHDPRIKTGVEATIPVLPIPLLILEKYKGKLPNGKLLPVPTNQKTNAYLKEIGDLCGIDKNLTFHLARHTFATTVTLQNGVSLESVSQMLGHSDLKTTQIYAKITAKKIAMETKNLSNIFKETENLCKKAVGL